jgi:hypothetical protein
MISVLKHLPPYFQTRWIHQALADGDTHPQICVVQMRGATMRLVEVRGQVFGTRHRADGRFSFGPRPLQGLAKRAQAPPPVLGAPLLSTSIWGVSASGEEVHEGGGWEGGRQIGPLDQHTPP